MGLMNDDDLPPLVDALEDADLPAQRRRLLRIGGPALAEALLALGPSTPAAPPLPLLLGAPESAARWRAARGRLHAAAAAGDAGRPDAGSAAQPHPGAGARVRAAGPRAGAGHPGARRVRLRAGRRHRQPPRRPSGGGAGRRGAAVQRRGSGRLRPRRGRRLPGRRARGRGRAPGVEAAGQPAGRRCHAGARAPVQRAALSRRGAGAGHRGRPRRRAAGRSACARCTPGSTARASGPRSSASRASATTRTSRSRCGPSTRRTPSGTRARRWGRSCWVWPRWGCRAAIARGTGAGVLRVRSGRARGGPARRRLERAEQSVRVQPGNLVAGSPRKPATRIASRPEVSSRAHPHPREAPHVSERRYRTIIEPHRIKVVEPIRMTTRAERERLLHAAGLQPVRAARRAT